MGTFLTYYMGSFKEIGELGILNIQGNRAIPALENGSVLTPDRGSDSGKIGSMGKVCTH